MTASVSNLITQKIEEIEKEKVMIQLPESVKKRFEDRTLRLKMFETYKNKSIPCGLENKTVSNAEEDFDKISQELKEILQKDETNVRKQILTLLQEELMIKKNLENLIQDMKKELQIIIKDKETLSNEINRSMQVQK